MVLHCLRKQRQELISYIFMDNKGFCSIADTYSLSLCIYDDGNCLTYISILVHINMAVSATCLNNRYCRVFNNRSYKPCAASWNKDINIFVHLHKLRCYFSVSILYKLYSVFSNPLLFKSFSAHISNSDIAVYSIASALKDYCISSLKCKRKGISCHIWS